MVHTYVDMQDKDGFSSLMIASLNGHTETVALLLKNGAHIDMQEHNGFSSLMIASQNGHTETVALLLQNGAHINMQENNGFSFSSLMIASLNGHTETVALLLQNGAHIDMQDHNGFSSLIIASRNGHTETVALLLQNGAHIDMQDHNGFSSLMIASQNGHTETVALLLQNGAHVNMQNINRWTSLMLASIIFTDDELNNFFLKLNTNAPSADIMAHAVPHAKHLNSTNCVQLLIQYGADINLQNKNGFTALMLSVIYNNMSTVSLLLKYDADITKKSVDGWSSLMLASRFDNWEVVDRISKTNFYILESEIDQCNDSGETALMLASLHGHTEVVKLLIKAGARVNISNFTDYQSLHQLPHQIELLSPNLQHNIKGSALDKAVICGNVEIVSLLLEGGAKVQNLFYLLRSIILLQAKARDEARIDVGALKSSASTGTSDIWEAHNKIIRLLFAHDADLLERVKHTKPSILYLACAFGVIEIVELLLQLGVEMDDLYRTDDSGSTYWNNLITIISKGTLLSASSKETRDIADLIHQVNWLNYKNIISTLIKNGLNINHQDTSGSFALSIASSEEHIKLIELLLEYRAHVNLQDSEGISSLMEASVSGNNKICQLLLRYGARIDLQDAKGWTSLMMAVPVPDGHLSVIISLLERGIQINIQDVNGTSALMLSCFTGKKAVASILLEHGADVNLQNTFGMTALMMGVYNGHMEIVELLMRYGADVNMMTSNGMTALKLSKDNDHGRISELLIECGAIDYSSSKGPFPYTVSRKRVLSTRDSASGNTNIMPDFITRFEGRLNRHEQILQDLLKKRHPTEPEKSRDYSEKPTLKDSFQMLIPIAHDWQNIGVLLGIDHNSLKNIEYDYDNSARDCLREMLAEWLKRVIPHPTWERLAEAIELTDQTIAQKIRKSD